MNYLEKSLQSWILPTTASGVILFVMMTAGGFTFSVAGICALFGFFGMCCLLSYIPDDSGSLLENQRQARSRRFILRYGMTSPQEDKPAIWAFDLFKEDYLFWRKKLRRSFTAAGEKPDMETVRFSLIGILSHKEDATIKTFMARLENDFSSSRVAAIPRLGQG